MNQRLTGMLDTICLITTFMFVTTLFGQDMEKHKWENRILVIQTTNVSSFEYLSQLGEFKNSIEELKERKLVLYELNDQRYKYTDFQKAKNDAAWSPVEKINWLKKDDNSEFKITLIGLDGGVKLDRGQPLKVPELLDLIDSMPMRMQELEQHK